MLQSFPYLKNNRLVLRIYAWLAGIGGLIAAGWGGVWFERDLPGIPFGMTALVRVFGTALVASGCWAAMLSQVDDPELRRTGIRWFAAGHLVVLLILHVQCLAVWPPVIASRAEVALLPEFGIVLLILMQSENCFMDRATGIPAIPTARGDAIRQVRTMYERQIRQAGAQEERNRLARDLHDSIKQQIFVIQTAAATVQARFESDRFGSALALDQVRNSARDAMTEMEVMMDQLRSVPLENAGLVDALKKQCDALCHRTGAKVEFTLGELPPNGSIPPGAHQTILRVAQEACANIGRHARAANVAVSLGSLAGQLELRIQDDGIGFDPSESQRGMGIANMRARGEESGGRFNLISRPRGGTTMSFCVPRVARLTGGNRSEYTQQALLFVLLLGAILIILPPEQRMFAFCAWSLAGAFRVVMIVRARKLLNRGKEST